MPFADETFVVAVSGGADSISLLLGLRELKKLKKLDLRLVAAHFNHQLRGEESEEDEQFVKNLAGEFGFELALGKKAVEREGNLEQAARTARYNFLIETAEKIKAQGVLTAHTQNDQAETFLLNLIRGSGLEGLGGMKPVRHLKSQVSNQKSETRRRKANDNLKPEAKTEDLNPQIILARPLLNWAKRIDTENFCHLNEIDYRFDSMNEDLSFKRVRIRKVLLPLLEDFNPQIVANLANTASLLREDFEELQVLAKKKIEESVGNDTDGAEYSALSLKEIRDIFPSMRRRVLREWLKKARGDLRAIEARHLVLIENLIFSRKSGKTIHLPNGETIVKKKGKLHFKLNFESH